MPYSSYKRVVDAFNHVVGDASLADALNDQLEIEISDEDTIDVDYANVTTTMFLDYLSIRVNSISFKFIRPVINTKVLFAPNRTIPLKLKGLEPRPHFYLLLGKFSNDNIFVLFFDRRLEQNFQQPSVLDPAEANAFYFVVAKTLGQFNKSLFIAQGAQSLVDTSFRDPFKHVVLDTVYD